MPDTKKSPITTFKGGFFSDLANRIKLVLRLMGDRRVSPLLKAIPVGSLVYLLFPDIAPGPIDDAAIIWLGLYLFVELCPIEVVEEHMRTIAGTLPGQWHEPQNTSEDEIIDAEFKDEQ